LTRQSQAVRAAIAALGYSACPAPAKFVAKEQGAFRAPWRGQPKRVIMPPTVRDSHGVIKSANIRVD
jgi:hypothetical protein